MSKACASHRILLMAEQNRKVLKGFQTVAEALRAEDYPLDVSGLNYAVGDIDVEDGSGSMVPIRDLTDRMPEREFTSAEDAIRALHDVLDRRKQAA
jgi:hypothetical protein